MARVLISLPDEFLADVDAYAEGERRSRSELIREALRLYMGAVPRRAATVAPETQHALDEIQRMRRDAQPSAGENSEAWLQARRDRHG